MEENTARQIAEPEALTPAPTLEIVPDSVEVTLLKSELQATKTSLANAQGYHKSVIDSLRRSFVAVRSAVNIPGIPGETVKALREFERLLNGY